VLLAPPQPVKRIGGTVLVCWKETAEASRALAAAIPLLAKSERVIVRSIAERKEGPGDGGADAARHLAWYGIAARCDRYRGADGRLPTRSTPP
jgi:hypothetical protein